MLFGGESMVFGVGSAQSLRFYWKLIKDCRFCCFESSLDRKMSIYDLFPMV